jgi:hypothetical protein
MRINMKSEQSLVDSPQGVSGHTDIADSTRMTQCMVRPCVAML